MSKSTVQYITFQIPQICLIKHLLIALRTSKSKHNFMIGKAYQITLKNLMTQCVAMLAGMRIQNHYISFSKIGQCIAEVGWFKGQQRIFMRTLIFRNAQMT